MFSFERFEALRKARGITKKFITDSINRSQTTCQDWKVGKSEPNDEQLAIIAKILQTSPEYLRGESNVEKPPKLELSTPAGVVSRAIDSIYDSLNAPGQKELCRYGKYLTTLDEYRREDEEPIVDLIPEYLTPAAAGYASPIEGEDFEMIQRPADAPGNADFCIKISGDSMEPYIKDGQRVYVKRGAHLESFDVGIFFVAGDVFCKQYCPGYEGQLYLLSANPDRQDANVILSADDARGCMCFGKVLLKKRPPKPSYF